MISLLGHFEGRSSAARHPPRWAETGLVPRVVHSQSEIKSSYRGVSFNSLLVKGVREDILGVPLSVKT